MNSLWEYVFWLLAVYGLIVLILEVRGGLLNRARRLQISIVLLAEGVDETLGGAVQELLTLFQLDKRHFIPREVVVAVRDRAGKTVGKGYEGGINGGELGQDGDGDGDEDLTARGCGVLNALSERHPLLRVVTVDEPQGEPLGEPRGPRTSEQTLERAFHLCRGEAILVFDTGRTVAPEKVPGIASRLLHRGWLEA